MGADIYTTKVNLIVKNMLPILNAAHGFDKMNRHVGAP